MDMGDKAASAGVSLSMVLEATESGIAELSHPAAGLSLSQRKLLSKIDGRRPLASFVGTGTGLTGERLSRDGLRLLALGLARTDEPFEAPATIMRPFVATGSTPLSPVTSAPQPAATSPRPTVRRTMPRVPKRGVPAWLWAGGAAVAAIAGGVLMLRSPSAPVQSTAATTNIATTNTTAAQSTAPAPVAAPPARPVTAAPVSVAPPAPPAVAVESRSIAEAAPVPHTPQPREVVTPRKPAAPVEKAPAPSVEREPRNSAPVERAKPPSAAVASIAPPPTRSEPERPAATPQPAPERSAPVEASVPAPVAPVAAAPSTAARPAPPPAATGPRALLPQEREFGAVVGDSDLVARQAAGLAPLQRTPPIYPRAAVKEGITEGAVRVRLTIAADGSVERVDTSVSDPRYRVFEHAARVAAMTWTFVPGAAGRTHESVVQFRAP
jgi:protein TonB